MLHCVFLSSCAVLYLESAELCPRMPGNHQGDLLTCGSVTFRFQAGTSSETLAALSSWPLVARGNSGYLLQPLLQPEKIALFFQTHCGRE